MRGLVADGSPVYTLDVERIRLIQPDLVIAQDLCHVCAVPAGAVDDALAALGCRAAVVSLDPSTLDEVIGCVDTVGRATGVADRAAAVTSDLRSRVDAVRRRVENRALPRVLALEWSDPLFTAGHWVPDMVVAAGGRPVLADAGARSRVLDWEEVGREAADVVVVMPCGYRLDAAVDVARELATRPELSGAREVWAVDADAYFSRPGPRVVDGVELLSLVLHPVDGVPPDRARAMRIR